MEIRNVAIIAHVDHGKTSLVDGFLKQTETFRENEAIMDETLIMDSNDQERERGITILAKNTSVIYNQTKINIIDTPGHADFGGEVERSLNMADGAILVIDAQEGPMPQTKFVLKKAFELGLKIMVVINKIDKKNADIERTLGRTYDLFLELATDEKQLDFPIYYAIAKEGKAWDELPDNINEEKNLLIILDGIIENIPTPQTDVEGPLQMLVSALDYDNYVGKYAVGKIKRGKVKTGQKITLVKDGNVAQSGKIEKIFQNFGVKKSEINEALSGDIVAIAGLSQVMISDTICDENKIEPLERPKIEEPTLRLSMYTNTSPFAGKEGKFVTARELLERIRKELETNVSMRLEIDQNGRYIVSGRGELHISVFVESLRREGYELELGKPEVITKEIEGVVCEPVEELTIDVDDEYANQVINEVNRRKGLMISQDKISGSTRLIFEISTRGTLGLRNVLISASRGTAVVNSIFLRYQKMGEKLPKIRNGALIAYEQGKAVTYGLNAAQERGVIFISPQTQVYEGMIVGLNNRENDLEVNVCKEKKLTNVRSSNSDISVALTPPTVLSLEQSIDFLEDDELLEVTPSSLRLRKKILKNQERYKSKK
ncbi:MAG: hypothetical protein BWY43_00106 [candidate division WS2 bacterium ADurb.Bin280]|uniref:50S ribosomal subunit assembly factor BipA n=1 Tax=candidate division WS2 bacterium ADurb.Bin280 TaxID=1852829 RepID=A0A1V5SF59_9BACT|nr:MAG: hypothetical protein BWY43_00106 [candidate division WS2 bacterium ADurb.Bin280]